MSVAFDDAINTDTMWLHHQMLPSLNITFSDYYSATEQLCKDVADGNTYSVCICFIGYESAVNCTVYSA